MLFRSKYFYTFYHFYPCIRTHVKLRNPHISSLYLQYSDDYWKFMKDVKIKKNVVLIIINIRILEIQSAVWISEFYLLCMLDFFFLQCVYLHAPGVLLSSISCMDWRVEGAGQNPSMMVSSTRFTSSRIWSRRTPASKRGWRCFGFFNILKSMIFSPKIFQDTQSGVRIFMEYLQNVSSQNISGNKIFISGNKIYPVTKCIQIEFFFTIRKKILKNKFKPFSINVI